MYLRRFQFTLEPLVRCSIKLMSSASFRQVVCVMLVPILLGVLLGIVYFAFDTFEPEHVIVIIIDLMLIVTLAATVYMHVLVLVLIMSQDRDG